MTHSHQIKARTRELLEGKLERLQRLEEADLERRQGRAKCKRRNGFVGSKGAGADRYSFLFVLHLGMYNATVAMVVIGIVAIRSC